MMQTPKKKQPMYTYFNSVIKAQMKIVGACRAKQKQKTGFRPNKSPSLGTNKQAMADPANTIIPMRTVARFGLQFRPYFVYML